MLHSKKSSYCIKLLHLALALSLLNVDPDRFLQQQWDSPLELSNGNSWELEILRAAPYAPPEYPYGNRKVMLPLIEDLVLYDRFNEANHLRTARNVTAYHLLSDGSTGESSATANQTSNSGAAAVQSEDAASSLLQQQETVEHPNDLNLFLNSEIFNDERSIWEQNEADLNDFEDVIQNYASQPLKVEPNVRTVDINLEAFLPTFNPEAALIFERQLAARASNDTFPEPNSSVSNEGANSFSGDHDGAIISTNQTDEDGASCSNKTQNNIKEEEHVSIDLSPFISQVELTKEESEIVEVLWKQDVDLGYSLKPRQVVNTSESLTAIEEKETSENLEKLKALEDCKLDKINNDKDFDFSDVDVDVDSEWAGIPFTIDNETGEYIRLPLDDLFKELDCLQEEAAAASPDNNDSNDISGDLVGASTSQAAFAAKKEKTTNGEDDDLEDVDDGHDSSSDNKENQNNKKVNEQVVSTENKYNSEGSNNNNLKKPHSSEDDITTKDEEEGDISFSDFEDDLPSPLFDLDEEAREEIAELDMMIQSAAANFHHHHHSPHPHGGRTPMAMQNYAAVGGANSAFHRQSSASSFHHHQGRLPLSRSVSMEQHLQDIASLFNPMQSMGVPDISPYAGYPPHPAYSYQSAAAGAQHGQYPHPPPPPTHARHVNHHSMLHANAALGDICAPAQPHYGHNLGSAVSSSMHLTNASHEADLGSAANGTNAYKMEHDMMYYSNVSSEMNHATDGFINSILNDEDLHLMDMNVNNDFCRMVDVNNTSNNSSVLGGATQAANGNNVLSMGVANASGMTADLLSGARGAVGGSAAGASAGDRLDASSDSAVSSMGSERVPSLSDGEWGDGSDSAQDYHHGKYGVNGHGPYDYSSYTNSSTSGSRLGNEVSARQPPVAQKKHQMFGKRFFNDQNAAQQNQLQAQGQEVLNAAPPAASIKYEYEPYALGVPASSGTMPPHNAIIGKEHEHDYVNAKYGGISPYSLDFSMRPARNTAELVQHNHTYHLPQPGGSLPKPQQRDKKIGLMGVMGKSDKGGGGRSGTPHRHMTEEEHLSRDEKRARALNIPITVHDIINLPMDEFNERLSKYDLNENQLSLIRDIRRRGKNKVAAQNCRKRKLDQILSLEDEVKEVRRRKDSLQQQREELYTERKRISNKFASLHRHIFQYLRDPEGNPCSPMDYSLQLATDGSVYLLPRDSNNVSDAISPITSVTPNILGATPRQNGLAMPQQQPQQQQLLAQSHHNHHQNQHHVHNHAQQQPHQRTQQQPALIQHNNATMQQQQQQQPQQE